jgi:hypothetical protein
MLDALWIRTRQGRLYSERTHCELYIWLTGDPSRHFEAHHQGANATRAHLLQKLLVSRRSAEVSFNKLPSYAAAKTRASVRPNTAVQVLYSPYSERQKEKEKETTDNERG